MMDNNILRELFASLPEIIRTATYNSTGQLKSVTVDWEERYESGCTTSAISGRLVPIIRIEYFENKE